MNGYYYNPFSQGGSGLYGNPYFRYSNPANFGLPDQSYAFTSFDLAPNPVTDTYVSQWYNAVIGPAVGSIGALPPPTWTGGSGPPGGGPPTGGSNPNPTSEYVSDLSTLGVTVPDGLTLDDIEKLANKKDSGRTVDGKITSSDVTAALQALEEAKSNGTLATVLPGKDLTNLYTQYHDYLGAISSRMPKPPEAQTLTSVSSISELGIDNPQGLTIADIEKLAGSNPPDGKIDKDEVKKAIEAIETNKRAGTLDRLLPGKDGNAVLSFLNSAYTKLGGKEMTFNSNKEALLVLQKHADEIQSASGEKHNKIGNIDGLKKIANGETDAPEELKAAAKYVLANQGLLNALCGDDGEFTMTKKRYTEGGAHTRLANGRDDLDTLINSSSVDSYMKASNDKLGFSGYGEVLSYINQEDMRVLIDKADNSEGKTDGWGTIAGLKHIVDNPSQYNQKLVDACKFILQHPDLVSKLGGEDGVFRMHSSVAGPAWWTNGQRDELRWLAERDDIRNKTDWDPGDKYPPPEGS